ESVAASAENSMVRQHLLQSMDSIHLYEESVNRVFNFYEKLPERKSRQQIEELNTEIVTANQFAIDSRENLRKAQIELRKNTDRLFSSIFEGRFLPLIVAISLSAIF